MSDVFLNYLNDFEDKQRVVSIYCDTNALNKFSAGFVSKCTEDMVLLKHVTPLGAYDGFVVIRMENILRVDSNGVYERKLELLYNVTIVRHCDKIVGNVDRDTNLFNELLKSAKEKRLVVNISLDPENVQESIIGFVKSINETTVVISQLTLEGFDDGETIFLIADIEKMFCDSEDDRTLGVINRLQKNL